MNSSLVVFLSSSILFVIAKDVHYIYSTPIYDEFEPGPDAQLPLRSVDLNLPRLDPLYVRKMEIKEGSGDISLDLTFRDVQIYGLSTGKIITVRSNLEDNKLEISLKYSHINLVGDFSGNGGVKLFPVVGNGRFYFNMSDVSTAWIIYLQETDEFKSHQYYMIDDFTIDIIPGEIHTELGTQFDGDNHLGAVVNQFINNNAQELFKITKPKIMEALSHVFSDLANRVLGRYPGKTLLPP